MNEDEKQSVINEFNSQIATAVKGFFITVIPLSMAGLGLLVSNHFGQQQLKDQVAEMSQTMKITNDRVTIMWMLGGYSERYEQFQHQRNETR